MDDVPHNVPPGSARTMALALVISSQAPVVLLDGELRVVAASASFYRSFKLIASLHGRRRFAELGKGEWNVPHLLELLQATATDHPAIEAYEMDLVRPDEATCHLLLSAHRLAYSNDEDEIRVVLTVTDVTALRLAEQQTDDLLREKQMLMQELQHRVANSLQIIASVLLQSARKVNSEETRSHLTDAHHRVMSIATLQKQLASAAETSVGLGAYLTELCESIAASMIAQARNLTLTVTGDDSTVDPRASVSLGLIVTELVINALKHAFPVSRHSGSITVDYRSSNAGWTLRVEDDGVGFAAGSDSAKPGLGTGIVEALAGQLDAHVTTVTTSTGTIVTIGHTTH